MWIGICLGDVTGIGPEVTLKALAARTESEETQYLLIGNSEIVHRLNASLGLNLSIQEFRSTTDQGRILVHDPFDEPISPDLAPGSPLAARAALACLRDGAQRCLRHELNALVTAPLSKEAVLHSGQPFIGQTEFLSELAGTDRTAMMLLGDDVHGRWLRVSLVTTHVPLRNVADRIDRAKVQSVIELTGEACQKLAIREPRIGVCGLNPHAGEGGELGTEEQTIITPAIEAARNCGVRAAGPFSADTLFYQAYHGRWDAVVAMYHDQGLAPLKMIAFESGVNWTLGLPFVRTSPDHGTAYDIAGQGKANPSSMSAAIRLAKQLVS